MYGNIAKAHKKDNKTRYYDYNIKSVLKLVDFYEKNADRLEPVRKEMTVYDMPYPQMKMIDMGFWQIGYELDTQKRIKVSD